MSDNPRRAEAKPEYSSIALWGESLLRYLIELNAFRLCPPLSTEAFRRFCQKRGVQIGVDLLEQFEKKDLFWPLFRARLPVRTLKPYEETGHEDAVREYVYPNVHHDLLEWVEKGAVYAPEGRGFEPWESFNDDDGRRAVENYYSPFQIYTLKSQLGSTGISLNAAYLADYEDEDYEALRARMEKSTAMLVDGRSREGDPRFAAVVLSQTISTRYYPQARSDERTITTPVSWGPHTWDWHEYAREWRAGAVVERLGISDREVRRYYEVLDNDLFGEPLEDWDDLLMFVKRSQRDKLKGAALLSDTVRTMRNVVGLLYEDLTGETLTPRRGALRTRYSRDARKESGEPRVRLGKLERDVQLLEFVVNRYGLNPRPALVLYVEGKGEEVAIPRLVERIWGVTLHSCRIEVRNLSGVAGFTGDRRDKYGALERVIEEHHFNQTSAFIILDNEGRGVRELRKRLSKKHSRYVEGRTVIRQEFIHIWERSIELDNFSDSEIAKALTLTSEGRHKFTDEEVAGAAASFGKKADPITKLYNKKLDYGLPKPEFLQNLVDRIESHDEKDSRPLLVILGQILELAVLNHQPTFVESWDRNQASGYLGHPTDGEDPLQGRFRELEKIQAHL